MLPRLRTVVGISFLSTLIACSVHTQHNDYLANSVTSPNEFAPRAESAAREKNVWLPLFDGKSLNGWVPKFSGYPVGENVKNTFAVRDGKLVADNSNWSHFDYTFGHLFFDEVFHHYKIRAEYRFVGEQVAQAPEWAKRNNGIFVHAQSAKSMWLNQDFPSGMEIQLLGGFGEGERSTGNICRSNVDVDINGEKAKDRCIGSTSSTYHGEQWVTVEIHVRGSERITHFINGEQVFDYTNIRRTHEFNETQFGDTTASRDIGSGYIAIQAESAPTEFRKIEIMILDDPFETN